MPDAHARLMAALRARDVRAMEAAASELERVELIDALDMVILLAETGDPRFPAWADRWVQRVVAERRLQPTAVERIRRLLRVAPSQNEARAVTVALRSYAVPQRTWS